MGLFDGILGQVSQHADVANMASKLGIDPAMAEKAIAALGVAHQQEGDTAELAAAKTGLDLGTVQSIIAAVGGEQSLSAFASMIDKDGDGSPVNDLMGMAKGLFGKS